LGNLHGYTAGIFARGAPSFSLPPHKSPVCAVLGIEGRTRIAPADLHLESNELAGLAKTNCVFFTSLHIVRLLLYSLISTSSVDRGGAGEAS